MFVLDFELDLIMIMSKDFFSILLLIKALGNRIIKLNLHARFICASLNYYESYTNAINNNLEHTCF